MSSIHDDFYEKDEKKEQEKSDSQDKIPRLTTIKMTPIFRLLLFHCLKQPHPLLYPLRHPCCSFIHPGKHPCCPPFIHSWSFWKFDDTARVTTCLGCDVNISFNFQTYLVHDPGWPQVINPSLNHFQKVISFLSFKYDMRCLSFVTCTGLFKMVSFNYSSSICHNHLQWRRHIILYFISLLFISII